MIPSEWIDQAYQRIAPHIRRTLLTNDAELNLYLKWENQQVTGSFKARGALNRVLGLEDWEKNAGLVTASAGNHGAGVALAAGLVGASLVVFVPAEAVPAKVAAIQALGAEVRFVPGGYEQAEAAAIGQAVKTRQLWISPYNDGQVIAGQATLGLELIADLPDRSGLTWIVPVGGGGLLSGLGALMERLRPRPRLVGVQAQASPFMHALFHTGSQAGVADLPTLADGLSGPVEADSLTIPMVRRYAEDILLVSEEDLGTAIAYAWRRYRQKLEGSAAAGLALVLAGRVKSPAVIVLTGGNIQPELHTRLCHPDEARDA